MGAGVICRSCGRRNDEAFRFCPDCGAPTAVAAPPPADERKVVTVLFCDLVGFTAASEQADPEDIRARLLPYYRLVRDRIEGHGGTVEKFVGDAVMAVFGVPTAHEDDPERAVRAGLRVIEALRDPAAPDSVRDLHVRIGINTGEVVVTAASGSEGSVTGDVVNTAARLQGVAPVDAVVVGEVTFRSTDRVFDYTALPAVAVKGKSSPVALWRAGAPRARLGTDVVRSMATPLVGRELEFAQLRTIYERVAREQTVHLVTLVGEPGVGKSRLVAELAQHLDRRPDLVTWRQGRCLPYGDGITYWALGEIVKAQAGVLDTDDPQTATRKLEATLPVDADPGWLRARLLPLLGVDAGAAASQEESFAAWRRYLEALAQRGPAVVVVEDLHWGGDPMLAFLEHLSDWAHGVPLLVLCTARPELFERHPAWGAGLRNATTVVLSRLSDEDTAAIVAEQAADVDVPADVARIVLDHAEGNPLYAEEFVRMLRDTGGLDRSTGRLTPPEGVHALIAARLDTLSTEQKSVLTDAAVVGKVFWAGAVATMGRRSAADVERVLHELARKELVRPSRETSMAGETEHVFRHALVRDVAYAAIPRAARAAKHLDVARWTEDKSAGRLEDVAEVLAHHTAEALSLATVTADSVLLDDATARARQYALLAADKAAELDPTRALTLLDRARALTTPGDPDRATVLLRWAAAARQLDRLAEAADAYQQAADEAEATDRPVLAGLALAGLACVRFYLGDPGHLAALERAAEALAGQPPSADLVDALAELAAEYMLASANGAAVEVADRAIRLAAEIGLPTPGRALFSRGTALAALGDRSGIADLEAAIELQSRSGSGHGAAAAYNNLGIARWLLDGPAAALGTWEEAIGLAERRGLPSASRHILCSTLQPLLEVGRFDDAYDRAGTLLVHLRGSGKALATEALACQARVLVERGDPAAPAVAAQALDAPRPPDDPSYLPIVVLPAAMTRLAVGDRDGARKLLGELEGVTGLAGSEEFLPRVPALVRCALGCGDVDLARSLVDGVQPTLPVAELALETVDAELAAADGDDARALPMYLDVAGRWASFGNRLERAYTLLGAARSAHRAGAPTVGDPAAEAAALFTTMGASARTAECTQLGAAVDVS